jgi:uncharacterized RDD family membrane protein YckC
MRRVYGLLAGAGGCFLAIAALVLVAWAEVTFTPPDQCAAETCGDIWLFPVFIGPWLALGAIVLLFAAFLTWRVRLRMLRGEPAVRSETAGLASPALRIVGGVFDLGVVVVIASLVTFPLVAIVGAVQGSAVTGAGLNVAGSALILLASVGYFGYFWSQRGQSIGMMPFGFKVRDLATDQYPSVRRALLRGLIWNLEVLLTVLIIGAIGWLWQVWDPRKQAFHDKVARTVVAAS